VSGVNGALAGNPSFLGTEVFAIAVVAGFSFFGTFLVLKIINFITPLRVTAQEEEMGLDESQHGEEAYA
jgi:Amt family ammonium transporter